MHVAVNPGRRRGLLRGKGLVPDCDDPRIDGVASTRQFGRAFFEAHLALRQRHTAIRIMRRIRRSGPVQGFEKPP